MVPSGWQQDDKVVLLGEPKGSVVANKVRWPKGKATDAPPASAFSLSFSYSEAVHRVVPHRHKVR